MQTRITMLLLTLALAVVAPAAASQTRPVGRGHWGESQAVRVQLGVFTPRGDSAYWEDKEFDFTGDAESFEEVNGGASYVRFLGPRLGLVASTNFYGAEESQHYRDFVDDRGREIVHDTTLELANLNLGLLLHLVRRDAAIVPYVGTGAGIYFWNLREVGDFIDFTENGEIFFGDFEDDGATFGYYFQAGLEVPVSPNFSVFVDGRWDRADDDLGGGFEGLGELDLSGRSLSIGASWSF